MDTGIVRIIDDLGRIVLPKEIRNTNNIKEGDKLSICIENGNIVLKKYSPLWKYSVFLEGLLKSINLPKGCFAACCDGDSYLTNGINQESKVCVNCADHPISNGIKFAISNANEMKAIDMARGISIIHKSPGTYHEAKKLYVIPNKAAIVIMAGEKDITIPEDVDMQIRFALCTMRNIKN